MLVQPSGLFTDEPVDCSAPRATGVVVGDASPSSSDAVSSTKKISIAAAILATGFCLALLFAAPRATYVPPDDAASGLQPGIFHSPPPSLAGPTGVDGTRLVPEIKPQELQPEPIQTLAKVASPVSDPSAGVAKSSAEASQLQARLVGIRSRPLDGTADAYPRTQAVSLPQVSVQVAVAKPVYATVEYPEVVTIAATDTVGLQPQASMFQASFDGPGDDTRGSSPDEFAAWADATTPSSVRTHIIIDGDSLPRLAARYLDNPKRDQEIFQLNQGVLTDPELLPIGLELKIPPRPLRPGTLAGWDGQSGIPAAERGLVPVYEIPVSPTSAPRAQLLKPMPAAWPDQRP